MSNIFDKTEVITAMVTPFDENLKVDFQALEKLVNHLIDNGSDAILVYGTTGESPTLTHDEEWEILKFVIKVNNGRVKIIAGAGSNCTQTAVMAAKKAEEIGADAILSVVPYYNKPNQNGIYAHFSEIADSVKLPVILYNIPGRTGINMLPKTVAKLAENHSNIVALKQSNGDLDLISETRQVCPDNFIIFSGDDSLTLPMLSIGANGVISVASHIVGKDVKQMITLFKQGKIKDAMAKHKELFPLFKKLFICPNPVPVKEALSKMGIIRNILRKPLVNMTEEEKETFWNTTEKYI